MNIVLIGVTGAGKTTIGRALAKRMNFRFYDMDMYIERTEQKSVAELFEVSEAHFRACEMRAAKRLAKKRRAVIATGGGAVLQPQLMEILQKGSVVVLIYRPVDEILKKLDLRHRPLLQGNPERLYEIVEERKVLYKKYGQIVVANEGDLDETVRRIRMAIGEMKHENLRNQRAKP